jgi:hypothetical protein
MLTTNHTVQTNLNVVNNRAEADSSGCRYPDGFTSVPVKVEFTFTPSGHPDFSNEIGIIRVEPVEECPDDLKDDLRGQAEGAVVMDDAFYDACCKAAWADRGASN